MVTQRHLVRIVPFQVPGDRGNRSGQDACDSYDGLIESGAEDSGQGDGS